METLENTTIYLWKKWSEKYKYLGIIMKTVLPFWTLWRSPRNPQTTLWKALLSAMAVQVWSPSQRYQHHLGTCQKWKFSGFTSNQGRWVGAGGGEGAVGDVKPHHLGFIRPCWWFWCSLRFEHHCANKPYGRSQDNRRKPPAGSRKRCFYSMQNLTVISTEEKLEAECRGRKF